MSDNLRKNYRHSFRRLDGISVELQVPHMSRVVIGDVLDLSLGGMRVRIKERNLPLHSHEPLTARSDIPGLNKGTGLQATVVYSQATKDGQCLGLQFVEPEDPAKAESRERTMWLYLMDQQRAQRRRLMLQPEPSPLSD